MDATALQALHDFYRNADPLTVDAVTRAQHQHRETDADRRGKLDALETAITAKTAARDRYRTAFESYRTAFEKRRHGRSGWRSPD
jgi:site-specific DNA recombinase